MNAIAVNCRRFTYANSEEPVLRELRFEVNYGEVTLLSGLSGCGKSTLLQLINGVIPRIISGDLEGEVLIDGEDIEGYSMSRISRKVGSVLQNAESQIIHQTVEDEIAFGCENFGVSADEIERRIANACKRLQLGRDWKTRTLSGGQKQRVVTASTLAMEPRILIFDEPLANLDQKGAVDLLELLRKLAREGKAILLVEHRLDVVLPYVDVVWQMENGAVHPVADKTAYLNSQISLIHDSQEDCITKASPAISCRQIHKQFGSRIILDAMNMEISVGERILLLGENGCGKSTLLNLIGRLLKPDSGAINQSFDPRLGKKADQAWFQAVGIVYQNPNYQLFMPSVQDEICFGAGDTDYALRVASRFGLEPLLDRHPQSLSEGQKRRVTIAAILAQKPKLLLLDEPTVGQDYAGLQQMVKVINAIHREQGNTMITITHDFRCAAALCDRTLWLEDGKIYRSGGKEVTEAFFRRQAENGFCYHLSSCTRSASHSGLADLSGSSAG